MADFNLLSQVLGPQSPGGQLTAADQRVQEALEAFRSFTPTSVEQVEPDRTPLKSIGAALADALHTLGKGIGQPNTNFVGQLQSRKERSAAREQRTQEREAERADSIQLAALRAANQDAQNQRSAARADVRQGQEREFQQTRDEENRSFVNSQRIAREEAGKGTLDQQLQNGLTLQRERVRLQGGKATPRQLENGKEVNQVLRDTLRGVRDPVTGQQGPNLQAALQAMDPAERQGAIATMLGGLEVEMGRQMSLDDIEEAEGHLARIMRIVKPFMPSTDPLAQETSGGTVELPPEDAPGRVGPMDLLEAAGIQLDKLTGADRRANAIHGRNDPR